MHHTNTRKGKSCNVWHAKVALSQSCRPVKMFDVAKEKENNVVNI